MSFIDAIAALLILSLFFFGFAQVFMPTYNAWEKAQAEFRTAKTIYFVAESFRNECKKHDRNMGNWRREVSVAKELESYEITELWQEDVLRALKAVCVIAGERVEVIGLCTP